MTVSSRYKQSASAPRTLDAVQDVGVFSQEDWLDWTEVGPEADTVLIPAGIRHRFTLPATARIHFVWIACGAYKQVAITDDWYVQACLNFYRAGRPVGSYLIGDSSSGAASVWSNPRRKFIRIRADGSGSTQPIMRTQLLKNNTWERDNLDIACFTMPILADRMEYEVEEARCNLPFANPVIVRTGCRIISFA